MLLQHCLRPQDTRDLSTEALAVQINSTGRITIGKSDAQYTMLCKLRVLIFILLIVHWRRRAAAQPHWVMPFQQRGTNPVLRLILLLTSSMFSFMKLCQT